VAKFEWKTHFLKMSADRIKRRLRCAVVDVG
jgi:hypothetical protein